MEIIKKIIFRLISGVLAIGFLFFGIGYIYNGIKHKPFEFDSTFKVALASCYCGIHMLVLCIRGK